MSLLSITDAEIQANTTGGSYERGMQYLRDGAVESITVADEHTLKAKVQGSAVHPYVVQIRFDEDEITNAECTCPYHEGSWCKHIAAVLLKVRETDEVPKTAAAAVAERVKDLDRDALVYLLQRLAEQNPDLLDVIDRERDRIAQEA